MSNTLFAELVAGAWVGTAGAASKHIAELVRTSLEIGRWVVVGIEHPRVDTGQEASPTRATL